MIKNFANLPACEEVAIGDTLNKLAKEISLHQHTIVHEYIMAVLARMGGDESQIRENLAKAVLHQEQWSPLNTSVSWYLTFDMPQRCGDWISIGTRKPKLDEDVLITNGHYVIKAHLGEWNVRASEYEYGSLVWFSEECHPCVWPFSDGEVIAWMPLPNPPEVSNDR